MLLIIFKRQSDVYIITLDAIGAFNRVNIYGLLSELIDRDIALDISYACCI